MEMLRAAQRGGYYVTAKVPATISTTHATNCALMHIVAAEQLGKTGVHGNSFFCRDFEANVVEMALEAFKSTPIQPAIMPLVVAYYIAWVIDKVWRMCLVHSLKLSEIRVWVHGSATSVMVESICS